MADTQLLITDDSAAADRALLRARAHLALYVGGMGARNRNFYNDLLIRYGFRDAARTVQDLYLEGRTDAAAAALTEQFVRGASLIDSAGYVADRVAAFVESGVSMLSAL